jgi:hypothetical protein
MRPTRPALFLAFASGAVALALGAFAPACQSATQVVVDVSTDVDCTTLRGTTITVGKLGDIESKPATALQRACDGSGHVGMLVVVPSGAKDDEVGIKVVTGVDVDPGACAAPAYSGCIVARRAVHFLPHSTLTLDVPMRGSCKGIACEPTSTCVRGQCRPAQIADPGTCTNPQGCGEESLGPSDGGVGDGGVGDGGGDGNALDGGDSATGPTPELSLGATHTCARLDDGTVKCWGSNVSGELGIDAGEALVPTLVPNLSDVHSVAAQSYNHTCALMNAGTVKCWGSNADGQLGRSTGDPAMPGDVPGPVGVGELALGRNHTCALSNDGNSLWCWGNIGAGLDPGTAQLIAAGASLADIAPGEDWTILRTKTSSVLVFGENYYGQLGLGNDDAGLATQTPTAIGITDAVLVGVGGPGGNHGCALRQGGELRCWGRNSTGEVGVASPDPVLVPTPVGNYAGASQLAVGSVFSCLLRADARVVCWGSDQLGELGADGISGPTPNVVPLANVTRVWAGEQHACARTADGTVYCWGANGAGQLGDGLKLDRSMPMPVSL